MTYGSAPAVLYFCSSLIVGTIFTTKHRNPMLGIDRPCSGHQQSNQVLALLVTKYWYWKTLTAQYGSWGF